MVFSSLLFLFRFLPAVILAYYLVPTRLRNGVLFIGSLVFYGWGEPVYITLLLFSTLVDFFHGQLVEHFQKQGSIRMARMAVASSVIINLGLLCFFKYTDFLIRSTNEILGTQLPLLGLALPVGISFYTFQTMSYTIDVYRGEAKAQKDLIAFGAYVSMFPQLIAGPIVRYHTIARELSARQESLSRFSLGVRRFCIGLGKKVLIANQAGALFSEISGMFADDRSILLVWLGIFAFGMQIYFDFSGYSDMAVGLGAMFGFHFRKFSLPLYGLKHYRVLEKVAYFSRHLVQGICLYSPWRKQKRGQSPGEEYSDCMAAHRHLARRRLQFSPVGIVLRRPSACGKAVFERNSGEAPAGGRHFLCTGSCDSGMGAVCL